VWGINCLLLSGVVIEAGSKLADPVAFVASGKGRCTWDGDERSYIFMGLLLDCIVLRWRAA
jgi:hypothetical protein